MGALGRGVVGLIGRKLGGHTIRAVAEHFNRDPVAITQDVKKVEAKLREESDFKQAIIIRQIGCIIEGYDYVICFPELLKRHSVKLILFLRRLQLLTAQPVSPVYFQFRTFLP